MPDFSILALCDNQKSLEDTGYNYVLESETIKELLINLYSNENPNITFEVLEKVLINFYLIDASDEMIKQHLSAIYTNTYQFNNNYFIHIVEYIQSSNGREYLYNIYKKYCIT